MASATPSAPLTPLPESTPSATSLPPRNAESAAKAKRTTKVLVTQDQIDRIFTKASECGPTALLSLLERELPRNTLLRHPSDYPEEPIDEELVRRVEHLQRTASELSARVETSRSVAVKELEATVSAASGQISAFPPTKPIAKMPERRVYPTPLPVANVLAKASASAADTRKRATRVREVLRMLCDNVDDQGDISCTIAADWSDTFEDLSKITSSQAEPEIFPLSPFVTPRSKTRRRVARFAGQMRRMELPR